MTHILRALSWDFLGGTIDTYKRPTHKHIIAIFQLRHHISSNEHLFRKYQIGIQQLKLEIRKDRSLPPDTFDFLLSNY